MPDIRTLSAALLLTALATPAAAQVTAADVTGGKVAGTAQGHVGVFKGCPNGPPSRSIASRSA